MATQPKRFVTVEEYLAAEESSLDRHEYLGGEVFAISGASPRHGQISVNILIELGVQLKNSNCRVRNVDTRLATSPSGLYSDADVVITCKPERFDGGTLLNPVVIIEVEGWRANHKRIHRVLSQERLSVRQRRRKH